LGETWRQSPDNTGQYEKTARVFMDQREVYLLYPSRSLRRS
jgi:hypothetical protein